MVLLKNGIFEALNHLSFLGELIDKLDFQDKCVSHDSTSNCVSAAPVPQNDSFVFGVDGAVFGFRIHDFGRQS